MNDYKQGDIVRHKATGNAGPIMTVKNVTPVAVTCTYWKQDDQLFRIVEFHPSELEKSDPPSRNIGF